jgi:multidrug efflux pump subunit AcrA (membrane-fusion protein)
MTDRTSASWIIYVLGVLCAGAIVAAVLVVGPASGSTSTVTRTATVAQGVVQSTVSGSGNLQPATQLDLGFKTSGTVTHIYVTQGQRVVQGQLIATLDPQSAEVTLEQSKAALQSAEATLAKQEETDGEGSTGQGSSSAAATGSTGSTGSAIAGDASYSPTTTTPAGGQGTPTSTTPTTTSTSPTTTTPATRTGTTTTTQPATSTAGETRKASGETKASSETKSTSSSTTSTISTATREANIASARAAVKSDALTAQSDEQAVANTRLYAPATGTIASLSGQVGEEVSATGTTRSTSSSSSTGSSSATSPTAATGRSSTSSSSSTGSTGSTGSSSSSFAVLADLSSMILVVPLSESEIGNVKVGQIATVTVEALSGRKLAAHVSELAMLSTSNSGVVSYDVTFQLDQMETGLRAGMSATAEVVVKQAEGINVPTTAITADTVTVVRNGKHVRQRVVTGLAGNSSTIILSGLKVGETIVLPTTTTTTSSRSSTTSRLGASGGGLGGGGLGAGGGGGAFFRGGGG